MANLLKYKTIFWLLILVSGLIKSETIFSQDYSPQAGIIGSEAIYKDSSIFVNWAISCHTIRGYINISDTLQTFNGTNKASFGADSLAIGFPKGIMDVVSLGDSGIAILSFEKPIKDEFGYDFAVFENGILDPNNPEMAFLELAFVEVSSDSIHFFRFPSVSETSFDVQIGTFDDIDASNITNLAGKHIADYGTAFDLSNIDETSPFLDLNNVKYVKIIDAIGSISPEFASFDSKGNIINDPFPTPFNTGGFDLEAVGVIHQNNNGTTEENEIKLFPNPVINTFYIKTKNETIKTVQIYNLSGKIISQRNYISFFVEENISPNEEQGIYLIKILTDKNCYTEKIVHTK